MFHLISKSKSFTLVKSKSKNNCGTSLRWTSTFIPEPEVIQSILNQIKNLKNEKIKPHKYCDFHFEQDSTEVFPIKLKVITSNGIDSLPLSEKVVGNLNVQSLPHLEHGLEAVLESKGLYPLKFEGKFLFSSFLQKIHQPLEINYERLPPFIPPSRDTTLKQIGEQNNVSFVSSTSSLTSIMVHLYYLFSSFKIPTFNGFSNETLLNKPTRASRMLTKPQSVFFRKSGNLYTIDQNKGTKSISNKILTELGKSLEKMLTLPPDEFNLKMLKASPFSGAMEPDIFHHLLLEDSILVRSQLDCYSPNKKITFDLKTRSTIAIRHNPQFFRKENFSAFSPALGSLFSFEKELVDMLRGVFLKYYFQVKLGKMGGIFVAYHNTQSLEGFEFFSEYDMGTLIFGSKQFSDLSFVACGKLLNHLFSFIRSRFSEKENLKITFFTNFHREMDIFVEELNSQMDSGYTTLLSTKDLDQNSDKKIPITWIKMKIAHEVNGKLIFGVRSYSQTDSVVLKVTFDEVKLSAKEILLNYNDAMQKSQLYALQDPIDLL